MTPDVAPDDEDDSQIILSVTAFGEEPIPKSPREHSEGRPSITTTERYTHTSSTDAALAVGQAVNGSIREVSNSGGETAASTGLT